MTIHWIIGIGSPNRVTIAEKSILTAESSGTTRVPRPTISKAQTGDFSTGAFPRTLGEAPARSIHFLLVAGSIQDPAERPRAGRHRDRDMSDPGHSGLT